MEHYFLLSWLIILSPLIVSPFILVLGKKLYSGGAYLAIASVIVSLISSIVVLINLIEIGESVIIKSLEIIPDFGEIKGFSWSLYLDKLSITTSLIVAIVSLFIFIFSIEYLKGDPGLSRYFAEITFFVGSMQGLVLANNLIVLYLFWEFVGLASYLLIGFWHQREEVASAARKAFIVTRIGDIFFLAGIIILWLNLSYLPTVAEIVDGKVNQILASLGLATIVPLLFFGGSIGKSAQFPLHVWLPDAMEGPTTVSALIHSATMVAAGVYLVARLYEIFTISPIPLLVVGFIGGFTALYAATLGLASSDIKRVLAYSTISQLGFMMVALGLRIPSSSIMHLFSHAFFKALMFLSAGAVIHELGTRNMYKMGGLKKIKSSYYGMLIGGLSLIAIPPFSGFFTKDPIIEGAFLKDPVLFLFTISATFFTSLYWIRLMYLVYYLEPAEKKSEELKDVNIIMKLPLYSFISLTVIFGIFMEVTNLQSFIGGEFIKIKIEQAMLTVLFTGVSILGILTYYYYQKKFKFLTKIVNSRFGIAVYTVLQNGYYFDHFYERIAKYFGWFLGLAAKIFDEKIIDGIVNGLSSGAKKIGYYLRKFHSGNLEQYLFYAFSAFVVLIIIILVI